ncbi:unnamed protein product [Toxocara canis]|uniref:Rab_eff_C domain-containing protein n=1 Tax=Toxocara canis TaxID=6265 RepID=A0A183VG43_TOXCA|nr:unnamed protein product [Toxocara canis]
MDEEAYRKNLVDEARKECELVQNEMDQLESEVDSTVQMCFIFDLCMDQVEKEAELEGLLKETTARCAQAGEHLDQAKDDVLRQSNVLKEIDEELKQISAPVVDTTVADKAFESEVARDFRDQSKQEIFEMARPGKSVLSRMKRAEIFYIGASKTS